MATSDVLTSGASGAAAGSAFGPWGTAIGGIIGIGAGLLGSSASKKAAKAKAAALEAQAQRRIQKGKQEAGFIKAQGERDKTSLLSSMLSSGRSRAAIVQDTGMDAIVQRAQIEADLAMEDAEYEASMIRQDAAAGVSNARDDFRASILGSVGKGLEVYGRYKEASR